MKKKLLIVILIPVLSFGQKLEVNEIDKFTKAHRMTTSPARLKTGMVAYIRTYTDTSGETSYFITLFGSVPRANVIGTDDPAIFLLDNDSTLKIFPTDIQSYTVRLGNPSLYRHQYRAQETDIKILAERNIKSIRKHGSDVYADVDIPEKYQDEVKKIAALILKELKK